MRVQVSPLEVMTFLNELYNRFDALLDIYKVYKVGPRTHYLPCICMHGPCMALAWPTSCLAVCVRVPTPQYHTLLHGFRSIAWLWLWLLLGHEHRLLTRFPCYAVPFRYMCRSRPLATASW